MTEFDKFVYLMINSKIPVVDTSKYGGINFTYTNDGEHRTARLIKDKLVIDVNETDNNWFRMFRLLEVYKNGTFTHTEPYEAYFMVGKYDGEMKIFNYSTSK